MLIQDDTNEQKIIESSSYKHPDDIESDHHYHRTTHLLCSFVWWTALSLIASLLIAAGFWLPYWIQGFYDDDNGSQITTITFSPFRRCNFPVINNDGNVNIMFKCIRYEHFDDIPSLSWKVCLCFR